MIKKFMFFSLLMVLTMGSYAQQERADPTHAPESMADSLRIQLTEFRALKIRALVVGSDDNGVAIFDSRSSTRSDSSTAVPESFAFVRAGSTVGMELGGMPLRVRIKSISSQGVEVESVTLEEKLFIPGSFKALPGIEPVDTGVLRYIECQDMPLEHVLRLISDQCGINLSASASVSSERISLFLRNVSADTVVEEICRTRKLWFRKDETTGITRVTTMSEYEESLSSYREDTTEIFTLLYPNVYEVAAVIYGLYPERVSLSLGEEEIVEEETRDINRRFERLDMISSSSGSGLLNNSFGGGMSGRSGYGGYGGGYGGYSSGSYGGYGGYGGSSRGYGGRSFGSGSLTTLRSRRYGSEDSDVIDLRVRDTYTKLSQSDAKQISTIMQEENAEARTAALETFREKSSTIFVTASKRNNILVVRTGDPQVMSEIRTLVKRLDVPTSMVLLEIKVMRLTLGDDFTSSFEYEFSKDFNKSSSSPVQTLGGFPGFNPLEEAANADAMSFMLLSRHLQARIQLLAEEGRMVTLATPTLLTANSEVSRLFIGEERLMVRNVASETVVTDENVVTTPQTQTELQPVGTMLVITPNINADRTVTLRLVQENSEILKDDANLPVVNSKGEVQNIPIDVVSSRSISGTFVAKDEMSVVVGGLIEEKDSLKVSKIPLLGDLPWLGFLFRSTKTVKARSELVLVIRPRVISTPAEGEAISRNLLEKLSLHPAADGRDSLNILKEQAEEIREKLLQDK